MKRFLMVSTTLLTLSLLLGQIFYPDFPLVWMASEESLYIIVRAAIVVGLTILLFGDSLKLSPFRPLLAVSSVALFGFAVVPLVSDTLSLADGVIFVETAIILALEFLESRSSEAPEYESRPIGKLGVGNDFVKIG